MPNGPWFHACRRVANLVGIGTFADPVKRTRHGGRNRLTRRPTSELKDQHGTPVRLADFRGVKNVVLVFYPLAFSGVCTGELYAATSSPK